MSAIGAQRNRAILESNTKDPFRFLSTGRTGLLSLYPFGPLGLSESGNIYLTSNFLWAKSKKTLSLKRVKSDFQILPGMVAVDS